MTDASTFGLILNSPGADNENFATKTSAATFGLTLPTKLKSKPSYGQLDVTPTVINPVVNFLDSPFRSLAGDIYGVTKPIAQGRPVTRDEYEKNKQQLMKATELHESHAGKLISSGLSFPGRLIGSGLSAASNAIIGPEATKTIAPFAGAAADVAAVALPVAKVAKTGFTAITPKTPEMLGKSVDATKQAKLENQGAQDISGSFARGLYTGGPSAADAIEQMQAARREGQPMALADVKNPELQALLGTIYRQGGPARARIKDFLEGRNQAEGERVREAIGKYVSTASALETFDNLKATRSANARPAFEKALAGGSIAPLQHQLSQAFAVASKQESEAIAALNQARQAQLTPLGRQQTNFNVYSSSAANRQTRESKVAVAEAMQAVENARREKSQIHETLVKAQADGSANAPGAVWSPHIQRMLDTRDVKKGIGRGIHIEENKAAAANKPLNTREYAIVGTDINGDPIVATVPNMKLLAVAKEGLDAIIEGEVNKETGMLSKYGHSVSELKRSFVNAVTEINPAYREATNIWAGDTANITAFLRGQNVLETGKSAAFPTVESLRAAVATWSPSEVESATVGLMDDLLRRVEGTIDSAGEARKIVNSSGARERLSILLGPNAGKFLEFLERERQMRDLSSIRTGAQTAERRSDDSRFAVGAELAHAAHQIITGRIPAGVMSVYRAVRKKTNKPNYELNDEIAKKLIDPRLLPKETGPIVPITPKSRKPIGPLGVLGATSTLDQAAQQ